MSDQPVGDEYSAHYASLLAAGLAPDEADLVAQRRVAEPVALVPLAPLPAIMTTPTMSSPGVVAPGTTGGVASRPRWQSLGVALALALVSGLLVRLVLQRLVAGGADNNEPVLIANFFLATIPFVGVYLAWVRRLPIRFAAILAAAVGLLVLAINLFPWRLPVFDPNSMLDSYVSDSQSAMLTALHLPVVLWLLVGVAYVLSGGRARVVEPVETTRPAFASAQNDEKNASFGHSAWSAAESQNLGQAVTRFSNWRSPDRIMDFIRFSGEWLVYLTMTYLLGGILFGILIAAFNIAGIDLFMNSGLEYIFAILVPAWLFLSIWLVEQTRSVVSRVLPVLALVFTPLMTLALIVILAVFANRWFLVGTDRTLLILLDVVLVVVLALVLYSISARTGDDNWADGGPRFLQSASATNAFNWLQFVMIAIALMLNIVALIAMLTRLAEWGWTPNRAAATGLNLLLLVHLAGTAWLLLNVIRGRRGFGELVRWQTRYLPVYLAWAAIVVLAFPPIFGFR
jgi:hypothetical protein